VCCILFLHLFLCAEELEHASDDLITGLLQSEGVGSSATLLPGPAARPAGHRILPVFVLSLLGLPEGLLLDRQHLHVTSVFAKTTHNHRRPPNCFPCSF
jgi:hypothetical protein